MAGSTIQRSMLSLLLLLQVMLFISGNGVNCLKERDVLLLPESQIRKPTYTPRCSSQRSRTEKGATILEMRHHDSSFRITTSWHDKVEMLLSSDESRVKSFQSQRKKAVSSRTEQISDSELPLSSGIKLQTLNFVVTIDLGGQNMTVIVDTGSDLTWVQCQPCRYCYSQQNPLFSPSLSPTFHSILCNSSTCASLQFATGNLGVCGIDEPNCNYIVNYGDGSYTHGELGLEQLKLGDTAIEGFIFGCGQRNQGLFGGVSGLMGLGRSQLSVVSQTLANFGGVFSYCLPSEEENLPGSLILGTDLSQYKNSTPISYTRIVSNPQMPTFYLLNFTGASVGGVPLQAPGFANGVTLIDSGTVITRLIPSVYKALKNEFLKQFTGYPSAPSFSILDTCFNLSGYREVEIPNLKLHFEGGVQVKIDVSGMFYFVKRDVSQVCLALASLSSEDDIGIIGNYQQKNLRVVYNSKDSELGFAEEKCHYL
ncbi:aspartyl protease family protein At5g10770 [Aristolochia californica]|uniref:aspartyl protease family protein At5g10770 n=1 Tax=Aristolochia californica TaxID=171875 RepID=UPI0035E30A3E